MSKLTYTPFNSGHIDHMVIQASQAHERPLLSPELLAVMDDNFGLSAWAGNECLGCAGIINVHPTRASCWALLSADAGAYMLPLTRKIKSVLSSYPCKRIDTYVNCDHVEGNRFAKLIGLSLDAERLECNGPSGEDQAIYSRIKR